MIWFKFVKLQILCGGQVVDHEVERLIGCAFFLFPKGDAVAALVRAGAVFCRELVEVVLGQVFGKVHGTLSVGFGPSGGQVVFGGVGANKPELDA